MIHKMQMLRLTVACWLGKLGKDEEGIVAIEYILLAVLIAIAFIVGAGFLGNTINVLLGNIANFVAEKGAIAGS